MRIIKLSWFFLASFAVINIFQAAAQKDYKAIDHPLKHQLEFRHDNDFLLTTDKSYSSGLFFKYRRSLEMGLFKGIREQIEFGFSQEIFTPEDTKSENVEDFDRPYAGITSFRITWNGATTSWLHNVELLLGYSGPNSGAGGFQRWYHKTIVIAPAPPWTSEIANSFHTNFYISSVKEWRIAPNPFGIITSIAPKIAIGTRDIYAEPELIMYFGRRHLLSSSIAHNRLGSTEREIYFALRTSYRQVKHNAMLEGNLINDSSPFTVAAKENIMLYGFDFYHRYRKHDYKLSYRRIGSETQLARFHQYIRLSYAYSF